MTPARVLVFRVGVVMLRVNGHHVGAKRFVEGISLRRDSVLLLAAVVLLGNLLIGGGVFATAQDADVADYPLWSAPGSWIPIPRTPRICLSW